MTRRQLVPVPHAKSEQGMAPTALPWPFRTVSVSAVSTDRRAKYGLRDVSHRANSTLKCTECVFMQMIACGILFLTGCQLLDGAGQACRASCIINSIVNNPAQQHASAAAAAPHIRSSGPRVGEASGLAGNQTQSAGEQAHQTAKPRAPLRDWAVQSRVRPTPGAASDHGSPPPTSVVGLSGLQDASQTTGRKGLDHQILKSPLSRPPLEESTHGSRSHRVAITARP
ncbi:hypothetical protein B0T19DRAFT_13725 [Cercophora scortea]|uniref:Uncharacterized protein n=1 Tax=Cercophora scortea TaxID=314031 RepID=A0AAE0ML22_9PEZI|nr:hypothetical protein B0T19DRAFT_13725 [Cercophora scortea]